MSWMRKTIQPPPCRCAVLHDRFEGGRRPVQRRRVHLDGRADQPGIARRDGLGVQAAPQAGPGPRDLPGPEPAVVAALADQRFDARLSDCERIGEIRDGETPPDQVDPVVADLPFGFRGRQAGAQLDVGDGQSADLVAVSGDLPHVTQGEVLGLGTVRRLTGKAHQAGGNVVGGVHAVLPEQRQAGHLAGVATAPCERDDGRRGRRRDRTGRHQGGARGRRLRGHRGSGPGGGTRRPAPGDQCAGFTKDRKPSRPRPGHRWPARRTPP